MIIELFPGKRKSKPSKEDLVKMTAYYPKYWMDANKQLYKTGF